ncbi:MAG: Mth938-like domain-containing protein [Aestuariivita sp.]|nr:Mth938-like domain-containing protein [Aestuariivita sp.]
MRLNEVVYSDSEPIEGYGSGFFRIGGKVHYGPIVTGPLGTSKWGGFIDQEPLIQLKGLVDVIFFGTGSEIKQIPVELRTFIEELGIGVEIMSSSSASRTYNVLLSEGRRIAIALLPV